jgi:hypothetical protein
MYVTKTWGVVLLNKKKYIYSYLKCIVYDKLLKPRQSFLITLYSRLQVLGALFFFNYSCHPMFGLKFRFNPQVPGDVLVQNVGICQ